MTHQEGENLDSKVAVHARGCGGDVLGEGQWQTVWAGCEADQQEVPGALEEKAQHVNWLNTC